MRRPRRLSELIEVERELAGGRPVFTAIDGRSGTGKSHLAERLAREVSGLAVVHMDDFYRELTDERRLQLSAAEGVDRFFDWQRLRREALEPLRAGRAAVFHPFDWQNGRLSETVLEISPPPFVLIEGVYSARAELGDLIDVTVLVQVEESERRRRVAKRHDDPLPLAERWEASEDYYFDRIRADDGFTLVVDGLVS